MGARTKKEEALGHPLALLAAEAQKDRRFLQLAVGLAVVFHLVLFALRLPSAKAEAPPERPPIQVFSLEQYIPPLSPQTPQVVPQAVRPVPIPDPTPDEPEPIRPLDVEESLPQLADPEMVIHLPAPPPPLEEEEQPIRVGGPVSEPRRIFYVEPKYPEVARRAGISGTVILEVVVGKDGAVKDVQVLRAAPMGLTEAAVEAVRLWRYQPSTLNGKAVEVVLTVTVRYSLLR
jgi:TonB family protein